MIIEVKAKARSMFSSQGNPVLHQYVITVEDRHSKITFFQSYDTIIARREYIDGQVFITLDKHFWSYSRTTGKYRNIYLGETKKETLKKIDSGEYELSELN
jgi:hypothetical protein